MCASMANIHSVTSEIRRGIKKEVRRTNDWMNMCWALCWVLGCCPIPCGDHN